MVLVPLFDLKFPIEFAASDMIALATTLPLAGVSMSRLQWEPRLPTDHQGGTRRVPSRNSRFTRIRRSPADQARLIATATNEAPSTRVAVATMVATTRVQAKICDCSNVTRLTTRAKRRVRMNKNSLHSAWHNAT
jgi:hypothetical protein